ncbi:hypothetical protein WJ972_07580 [Achromobacter insuavis]
MSEWTEVKARFKRPLEAAGLCLLLLFYANHCFDDARRSPLPPDPAKLHAVTLRIDKVSECPYSRQASVRQNSGYSPGCFYSDDHPGVAFEKSGSVAGLDIALPQRLELLINHDPSDLRNHYEGKLFSVYAPINIYGVRQADGTVLVDPAVSYDKAWSASSGARPTPGWCCWPRWPAARSHS